MPTDNQIPAVSTQTLFQRCFKSALPALKQNLPFCTLLLSSALPVAPVYAQTSDEWDELDEDTIELPETVVTANRYVTPLNQVGSALSILDADELEARQIRVVADALRAIPGVAVSRSGGLGALTDVRIRGAENNHTLVLIDGVEANDPAISAFDFSNLLNVDIERIEILRGPQSALWGSDAIGGVINIITKRGEGPARVSASVEGGSFQTGQASVGLSGSNAQLDYSIGATVLDSEGFSISPQGSEKDGYHNVTLAGKAGYVVSDQFDFKVVARYIDAQAETDPQDFAFPPTPTYGLVIDGDDESETQQFYGRAEGTLSLADGDWEHTVGVALTDTNSEFFSDGARTSKLEGEKLKFDYQTNYYLTTDAAEHIFTLALEHEDEDFTQRGETVDAPSNQDQSITTRSVVGQYGLDLTQGLSLTASLRFDDNENFDDATTYRLTGAYTLPDSGTRFHTSYGTGVKNPTFTELFGFFPGSFIGNPDLQPEEARSWDIGVEQSFFEQRWLIDLTYFNGRFEDEIITTFDNDTFLSSVTNADGTSRRKGVELSVRGRLHEQLDLTASYSYVDSEDPDGEREVRRPRHTASLNLDYRFWNERARLNLGVDYTGEQDDLFFGTFPSTRVVLDAYTLVNLRGSYQFSDNVSLYGRIENLLDEDYQDVYGYATAGIGGYAGVKASF